MRSRRKSSPAAFPTPSAPAHLARDQQAPHRDRTSSIMSSALRRQCCCSRESLRTDITFLTTAIKSRNAIISEGDSLVPSGNACRECACSCSFKKTHPLWGIWWESEESTLGWVWWEWWHIGRDFSIYGLAICWLQRLPFAGVIKWDACRQGIARDLSFGGGGFVSAIWLPKCSPWERARSGCLAVICDQI